MQVDIQRLSEFLTVYLAPGGYFMLIENSKIPTILEKGSFKGLMENMARHNVVEHEKEVYKRTDMLGNPEMMIILGQTNGIDRRKDHLFCNDFSLTFLSGGKAHRISQGITLKRVVYATREDNGEFQLCEKDEIPELSNSFYNFFTDLLIEEGVCLGEKIKSH